MTWAAGIWGRNVARISRGTSGTNVAIDPTTATGYRAGNTDVIITIEAGVTLRATTTANAALTLGAVAAGDRVILIVKGRILGKGGNGGGYDMTTKVFTAPTVGGPALEVNSVCLIDATLGFIGGGGGGSGVAASETDIYNICAVAGSGGAGGGNGGTVVSSGGTANGGSGASATDALGIGGVALASTKYLTGGAGGGTFTTGTVTAGQDNSFSQSADLVAAPIGGTSGGGGGIAIIQSGATKIFAVGSGGGGWGCVGGSGLLALAASSGRLAISGEGGGNSPGGSGVCANTTTLHLRNGAAGGASVKRNGNTITWMGANSPHTFGPAANVYGSVAA